MSFAEAANKYSDDPANEGGAGGDLDWFLIEGMVVEEFAIPAFKLRKGEISQPVETPYGLHLIQVTDRKEGRLPDYEKVKPYILQAYSKQLNDEIVAEERKSAKIEVKPMPKDFFPSAPAQTAQPGAAPGNSTDLVWLGEACTASEVQGTEHRMQNQEQKAEEPGVLDSHSARPAAVLDSER